MLKYCYQVVICHKILSEFSYKRFGVGDIVNWQSLEYVIKHYIYGSQGNANAAANLYEDNVSLIFYR